MLQPPQHRLPLAVRQHNSVVFNAVSVLRNYHGRRIGVAVSADAQSRDYRRASYKDGNGVSNQDDAKEARDERELSITQRERQLWDRQERMYEREMARWDQERQYWHQREAMLLQHISKLHTGLLTLAELQTKQLPAPEGEEGVPGESAARARAALVTDRDAIDAVVDQLDLPSGSDERAETATTSEAASGKLVERAWSSLGRGKFAIDDEDDSEARVPGSSQQGWGENDRNPLASQFESAISAVDKVDILRDEPNFLEVDYSRQEVKRTGNGVANREVSISTRQVSQGKEDEEDELEKQMLKALDEIAQMVGESEMAVEEILEAALPQSSKNAQEPKKAVDRAFSPRFGVDAMFEPSSPKPDQEEPSSGGVAVPTLVMGADDVFWVSTLHQALSDKGYYCGDEEAEDMYFGDGTFSALVTFQVAKVDASAQARTTSQSSVSSVKPEPRPVASPPTAVSPAAADFNRQSEAPTSKPSTKGKRLWAALFASDEEFSEGKMSSSTSSTPSVDAEPPAPMPEAVPEVKKNALDRWPILREGDGGTHVHQLHCALGRRGYHCGEDDEVWWQFGDSTFSALVAFQACNNLPESGVVDHQTWVALLGVEAHPGVLGTLRHGDHRDDDMLGKHHEGMVFLIGEQRWASRKVDK